MKYELQGHIVKINETETKGARGFQVRTFWVETQDKYPQVVEIQVTQDKCHLLDKYQADEPVLVHFNIRGRIWEPRDGRQPRVFNTLNAWKIESLEHPEDRKQRQREEGIEQGQKWLDELDERGQSFNADIPF